MPAIYQPNDRTNTPTIYERDNDRADMPTILITVVPICLRHEPQKDNSCADTPTVYPELTDNDSADTPTIMTR